MRDVPFDAELAERIRRCLDALEVREVAMFGGRSFMVHDQLTVAAASDGTLLIRCAPDQLDRLLRRDGAQPAEMRGKPMSPGWIRVDVTPCEMTPFLRSGSTMPWPTPSCERPDGRWGNARSRETRRGTRMPARP